VFDFDACGVDVGGKEQILRFAAQGLLALPEGKIQRFFVFEDAPSGTAAAKSLGYYVVGVLRIGEKSALERVGADIVTEDLATIELEDLLRLGA
jgi:beta-phosphoglucomutase-like phosphatase (HAD superfamily)